MRACFTISLQQHFQNDVVSNWNIQKSDKISSLKHTDSPEATNLVQFHRKHEK